MKRQGAIIFGGSFDPITTAHVGVIENLCARFERVLVVPAKCSPFKSGTSAGEEDRLNMLHAALASTSAELTDFELRAEGASYTYLTVRHFFKEGEQLYLALGSEMINGLSSWKCFGEIADKVTVYVMPRPDFIIDEDRLNEICRYEIADFEGGVGSSSEVRITIAQGESERFLPRVVAEYVQLHGLYREYCYVNELYTRFNLKPKRIAHSFSAALCAVPLAKRLDVPVEKAITAMLLHDIGKSTSYQQAEAMGVRFDTDLSVFPEPVRHAEIGACIAEQLLGIEDKDIIGAIRWHTTGRPSMTSLEKIAYLADYIEPLRTFNGVEQIREIAKKSVDDGLLAALENSVSRLDRNKSSKITLQTYEYYKNKKG